MRTVRTVPRANTDMADETIAAYNSRVSDFLRADDRPALAKYPTLRAELATRKDGELSRLHTWVVRLRRLPTNSMATKATAAAQLEDAVMLYRSRDLFRV